MQYNKTRAVRLIIKTVKKMLRLLLAAAVVDLELSIDSATTEKNVLML